MLLQAGVARFGMWQEGIPEGGALCLPEGHLRLGPHPPPAALRWGRFVVCCPHAVGAGLQVWAPSTGPLTCMPCQTLRAAPVAGVARGGASTCRGEGRLGIGAQPPLAAHCLGRQSGSIALGLWAREVRVWQPGTDPMLHSFASQCYALLGWHECVPVGDASCLPEVRLGFGTHPPPAARPSGRESGAAALMLWVRVCRHGNPALAPRLGCPAGCSRLPGGGGHLWPL